MQTNLLHLVSRRRLYFTSGTFNTIETSSIRWENIKCKCTSYPKQTKNQKNEIKRKILHFTIYLGECKCQCACANALKSSFLLVPTLFKPRIDPFAVAKRKHTNGTHTHTHIASSHFRIGRIGISQTKPDICRHLHSIAFEHLLWRLDWKHWNENIVSIFSVLIFGFMCFVLFSSIQHTHSAHITRY